MPNPSREPTRLLLLAATQYELRAIVRRSKLTWQGSLHAQGYAGPYALLACYAGMGMARACDALSRIIAQHPVEGLVHVGFAGALDPRLKAGHLLRLHAVCDAAGNELPVCPDEHAPLPAGKLLTLDRVLHEPAEKAAWQQRSSALAVDMESFAVARYAWEHRLAYSILRVVSDEASTRLPKWVTRLMSDDGRLNLAAVARHALARPDRWATLHQLRQQAERAGDELALAVERILHAEQLPMIVPGEMSEKP